MTPELYAQALFEAVKNQPKEKVETRLTRFLSLLRLRGHLRALPRVLGIFERLQEAEASRDRTLVTTASHKEAAVRKEEIAQWVERLRGSAAPVFLQDSRLTGGFIVQTRSHIVDASDKKTLIELYRRLRAQLTQATR